MNVRLPYGLELVQCRTRLKSIGDPPVDWWMLFVRWDSHEDKDKGCQVADFRGQGSRQHVSVVCLGQYLLYECLLMDGLRNGCGWSHSKRPHFRGCQLALWHQRAQRRRRPYSPGRERHRW